MVLSGALFDGASGAAVLAAGGGLVLVQQPADALVPSMPEATLRSVPAAHTADAPSLAEAVAGFARTLAAPPPADAGRTFCAPTSTSPRSSARATARPGRRAA